jgi:hypothetical protein
MSSIVAAVDGGNRIAVPFTWFARNDAAIGQRHQWPWDDLCRWISTSAPHAGAKDALPLIKLATFSGDHRTNATAEAIHGIEGDYDAELMQPAIAAGLLTNAGIAAFIYTSPSHRPDKPRWRVLCPLSHAMTPADRHGLVARLNGTLGGTLAAESFTVSQAFYVGSVAGGEPVQCWNVSGRFLDTVDGLIPNGPPEHRTGQRKPLGSMPARSWDDAVRALYSIDPNDLDYPQWRNITAAFRQATTGHTTDDMIKLTWDGWCATFAGNDASDNNKLWHSLKSGTNIGWDYLRDHASPDVRASLIFGSVDRTVTLPAAATSHVDFLQTLRANDAGKSTAAICTKTLTDWNFPVAWDEFSGRTMVTAKVPWDHTGLSYPHEWTDRDTHGCKILLEATFITPSKETVFDSVNFIADRNRYHPVRDYLNGLCWDRIERLPSLAQHYFGADHTPFVELISAKFMISAVARIVRPGCKADTMIILEGAQGAGKSSALRALVSDEWFTDQMPDFSSKDASIQLRGKWLIEVAELDRMNRTEVTAVKSYASRQIDTYRPPYGKATVDVPRQCIFAGSTNETEYLRDQTGNRRFWPITCGTIDVEAIRRDRDQLWAEATTRYHRGETWWLEGDQERLAQEEQDGRRERDPWEAMIASRLASYGDLPITIEHVCRFILDIPFERQNTAINKRVASCLKHAGYKKERKRQGADRIYHYVKA